MERNVHQAWRKNVDQTLAELFVAVLLGRRGIVLWKNSRMRGVRAGSGVLGHPMSWPLGPKVKARPLNI